MKNLIIFLAVMVCSFKVSSQTILAEYNFDASSLVPTNFAGSLVTASNVTYTNVNLAGFTNGVTGAPDMAPYFNQWPSTPIIIDPTKFLEITITSNPGITVQVNRIRLWERFMNNGPSVLTLRSSSDGFSSNVYQNASGAATFWEYHNLAIGPFTISNGASISFRIYAGATNSNPGSTFSIDSVHIEGQDITTLPIELISFTGSSNQKEVQLNWTTASERDNDFFTVYRSADLEIWEEVADVPAVGNSQNVSLYETFDRNPLSGVNYYKLRQTDFDSTFTESDAIAVNFQSRSAIAHYVVGEIARIDGQRSRLVDALGRVVAFGESHQMNIEGRFFLQGKDGVTVKSVYVFPP